MYLWQISIIHTKNTHLNYPMRWTSRYQIIVTFGISISNLVFTPKFIVVVIISFIYLAIWLCWINPAPFVWQINKQWGGHQYISNHCHIWHLHTYAKYPRKILTQNAYFGSFFAWHSLGPLDPFSVVSGRWVGGSMVIGSVGRWSVGRWSVGRWSVVCGSVTGGSVVHGSVVSGSLVVGRGVYRH